MNPLSDDQFLIISRATPAQRRAWAQTGDVHAAPAIETTPERDQFWRPATLLKPVPTMTTAEVAQRIGVTYTDFAHMRRFGLGPKAHIAASGNLSAVYLEADVDAWLATREARAA